MRTVPLRPPKRPAGPHPRALARVVSGPLRPNTEMAMPQSTHSPCPPETAMEQSHTPMKPQHHESSNGDPVIESFQQTMQMFLEVQRSTMLAYLSGRGAGTPPPSSFTAEFKDRARNHAAARSNAPHANGDAGVARARPTAEDESPRSGSPPGAYGDRQIGCRAEWKTARARSEPGASAGPRRNHVTAARNRARSDRLSDRDARPRPGYGSRPGNRFHQASRDPRQNAR